jgi:hypothetical protein
LSKEQVAIVVVHQALSAKRATHANPSDIPPALLNLAVRAAGGGATEFTNLTIINSIKPQSTYLEKVGPGLLAL